MTKKLKNLGDILLEKGVIDRNALKRALELQSRRLGEILVDEQFADAVSVYQALKQQATEAAAHPPTQRVSIDASTCLKWVNTLETCYREASVLHLQAPALLNALESMRLSLRDVMFEPVEQLFHRARLLIDEMNGSTQKQIRLETKGGGVSLDRAMSRDLWDAISHLIRNSVEHGFEKDAKGVIFFSMHMRGSDLEITIQDNGRGLQEDKIYERAKDLKITEKSRDQITREEIYRFLFRTGFSTSKEITRYSGRGIGLDVVEYTVLRLFGKLSVQSDAEKGTLFKILLPLKSARISVLPVQTRGKWYAVSANEVLGTEPADSRKLNDQDAGEVLLKSTSSSSAPTPVRVKLLNYSKAWVFDEVGQLEDALFYGNFQVGKADKLGPLSGVVETWSGMRIPLVKLQDVV